MTKACALCLESGASNRCGGVDLCDTCFEGGASERVKLRGWSLEVKLTIIRSSNNTQHGVKGTATCGVALFRGRFAKTNPLLSVLSLVFGVRVRDPLFHRVVAVFGRDKSAVSAFLADDGAQSAVMDLVGEGVGFRTGQDGVVRLRGTRNHDPFDQITIERELAVMLIHLHRFSQKKLPPGSVRPFADVAATG